MRATTSVLSFTFLLKSLLTILLLASLVPAAANAAPPCASIEAVFFDLGDTLVEQNSGTGLFDLKPGAADTVTQLQNQGIRLGVITNVPSNWTIEDLEALLAEPEFLQEFEVVVLSSQAPAPKPAPAIYTFAHGQLSNAPPITSTAFVGETLGEIADAEPATEGARSVGMLGIHLSNAAPNPLADFTISPDDLPAIATLVQTLGQPLFCDGFESGDTTGW